MDTLKIDGTKSSPKIELNFETNLHTIKGESYPENTIEFYTPILNWLKEYIENLNYQAVFNFEIIYFNSSSSKVLMDIFDMFEEACEEEKKDIIINWIYDEDNDAALEYGEEFAEDLEFVTFKLVEK
jgi:hypothetical protein